jgi:hypothetical protein
MQFKFGDTVKHPEHGIGRVVGKGAVHEDVVPYPGGSWAIPTGQTVPIVYIRFGDGSYSRFRGDECYELEFIYVAN